MSAADLQAVWLTLQLASLTTLLLLLLATPLANARAKSCENCWPASCMAPVMLPLRSISASVSTVR